MYSQLAIESKILGVDFPSQKAQLRAVGDAGNGMDRISGQETCKPYISFLGLYSTADTTRDRRTATRLPSVVTANGLRAITDDSIRVRDEVLETSAASSSPD